MVIAQISIIYSESNLRSKTSKNLALYLAANFTSLGRSKVSLVPFYHGDKNHFETHSDLSLKRLSYIPPSSHNTLDAPLSDITFDNFSILSACHIVCITALCVSEEEEGLLADKISQGVQNRKNVVIFLMQSPTVRKCYLKQKISGLCSGAVCLECVVGFSVVQDSRSKSFMSLIFHPSIVMPRLGKDIARVAEGPVNLLEATNIQILYRPQNSTAGKHNGAMIL